MKNFGKKPETETKFMEYDKAAKTKLEIYDKWDKYGLLKGITDSYQKAVVAVILENQRLFNEKIEGNSFFKRISIPIVRRVFGPSFIGHRIVSVQPTLGPMGIVYYADPVGKVVSEEVVCHTRFMKNRFPFMEFSGEGDGIKEAEERGYKHWQGKIFFDKEYSPHFMPSQIKLDEEAEITCWVCDRITKELNEEVITDIYKNSATTASHNWESSEKLGDAILAVSNEINRNCGKSANWIITSPLIAERLVMTFSLKPADEKDENILTIPFNNNCKYVGKLVSKWDLIIAEDAGLEPNQILMGFRGASYLESSYFYCPYIAVSESDLAEVDELFGVRGILTRYSKKMMRRGNTFFGRLDVEGLTVPQWDFESAMAETIPLVEERYWLEDVKVVEANFVGTVVTGDSTATTEDIEIEHAKAEEREVENDD